MDKQEKQELFLFLQKFCSDNAGNKLNEWIIESFLNRVFTKLGLNSPKNDSSKNDSSDVQKQ